MLTSSPVGYNIRKKTDVLKFTQYKPTSELVVSLNALEAGRKKVSSMEDVINLIKTGRSQSVTIDDVSILDLGNLMYNYSTTHRQIISSVDGLGAAVDSLKANDAAVIEYHDKRVFDYKVGSLSGGKDVYVKVRAEGIGPGAYTLIVSSYLIDQDNPNDTIYLGAVGLRRWGMPHALRNSPIERRFAYLWEDVQSFIKALRVYEFKDENGNVRYVAFFAAQEYMPRAKEYIHYYNIAVTSEEGEGTGAEKKFEPYYGKIVVPGMKMPLKKVNDIFTIYGDYFTGTILAVLKSNGNVLKEYYGVSFAVNEKTKKPYGVIESSDGIDIPKDVDEWVLIGSK